MAHIAEYDYSLPDDLIAQHPLARRSDARLMIVDRDSGALEHAYVRDLPEFLRAGDALVLNDSRVVPARLVGFRANTGGKWQGLYLGSDDQGIWRVLGKTRGKLAVGETLTLLDRDARPSFGLTILAKLEEGQWAVKPQREGTAWKLLEEVGRVPLPHYIRDGNMVPGDLANYQTVFAQQPGSIAAPTAGLHFTPELLEELTAAGVTICHVTLHVGVGTFRPISAEDIEAHTMHSEWATLAAETSDTLDETRRRGGRIIAVGSTSTRTLETAAQDGDLHPFSGQTDLYIRPPYRFRAVDAMLTNFHLPRSTLLVLVRTFGGDALIREAYATAVREQYRFFSYGDAMLIL